MVFLRPLLVLASLLVLSDIGLSCEASLFAVCREPGDPVKLEGVPVSPDC